MPSPPSFHDSVSFLRNKLKGTKEKTASHSPLPHRPHFGEEEIVLA